jgi:hypothetical protein
MISIIKNSLPSQKVAEFQTAIANAKNLTEKKRFYISDYGFENSREVILGQEEILRPGQNYDKFHFDNLVKWWKNKASNRYEALKSDGRLRTELETWNRNPEAIDIIR